MFNFIKSLFCKSQIQNEQLSQEIIVEKSYIRTLSKLDKEVLECLEIMYEQKISEPLYGDKLEMLASMVAISNLLAYVDMDLEPEGELEFYNILENYFKTNDYYSTCKKLEELLLRQKFEWELYDKCVSTCEELKLYPYYYQYLKRRPKAPQHIKEAATFLTFSQLKSALKRRGEKSLPKIKESVMELFVKICTLEDCQLEIDERLALIEERFRHTIRKEKINAFVQSIITRQQAIVNHYIYSIRSNEKLYPKLVQKEFSLIRGDIDDSSAFYKSISTEHEHISEDGEVLSLPPYYPADCSYINYHSDEE